MFPMVLEVWRRVRSKVVAASTGQRRNYSIRYLKLQLWEVFNPKLQILDYRPESYYIVY